MISLPIKVQTLDREARSIQYLIKSWGFMGKYP